MIIKHFIFGPFQTNTYVAAGDDGRALIIDPACSNSYEQQTLLRYIQTENLRVAAIIATHGHLDHLWGAPWATKEWQLPVLMHEADIPMAERMQEQYDLFGIRATAEPFPIENLTGEAGLTAKNEVNRDPVAKKRSYSETVLQPSGLSILPTPGHTPGSVCLYWEKEKVLFSGDTLFRMGYGRTDLPGGDTGLLVESLLHLFDLPPEVRVFTGHGDCTTIGAERR